MVCVCVRVRNISLHSQTGTNTVALREECRFVALLEVKYFRFVFSLERVYFLLWYEATRWQKSCLINQCLSACVVCVSVQKGQDMIWTYLCSHSWHSLCSLPDKQGIPPRTGVTCVLCCNYPQHVMYFFSGTVFFNVCGCVCERECVPCVTVCGLNQICPAATEENDLIPTKMKGFIFNVFVFLKN